MLDFLLLKNIDFSNSSTLIFLFIIFILVCIVFLFFFFAIYKIIKAFKKVFNIASKKPKPAKAQESKEVVNISRPKITGGDFIINRKPEAKPEEKNKNIVESQQEKNAKDIAARLLKLKAAGEGKEEAQENNNSDDFHKKIKIPRAKSFQGAETAPNVAVINSNPKVRGFEKIAVTTDHGIIKPMGVTPKREQIKTQVQASNSTENLKQDSFFEKHDILKNIVAKEKKSETSTMFGDKDEISRIKLKYKLLKDPEIWKAQRDLRMNLSPVERAKLEKGIFAPIYGRNISKKDLKLNLKRMGREWAGTTDMKKKEFLRKEIKFFKKIGGIK